MKLFGGLMSSDDMEKEGHYYDGEGRSVVEFDVFGRCVGGTHHDAFDTGGFHGAEVDVAVPLGDVDDDATLNFAEAKAIAESVIGCKLRISLSEPVRKV